MKHILSNKYYLILFITCIFTIIFGCKKITPVKPAPRAENGILDLRQWDFSKDGSLMLNGTWKFWWQELIEPDNFRNKDLLGSILDRASNIKVGKSWKGQSINKKVIETGTGYGTYYLRILLTQEQIENHITIFVNHIIGAHEYFVSQDPKFIIKIGNVGKHKNEEQPWNDRKSAFVRSSSISLSEKYLDLIVHTSNFRMKFGNMEGGITFVPKIGYYKKIQNENTLFYVRSYILVGILLTLFLYHFILYLIRKKDKSSFYFSLFTLDIVIYTLISVGPLLLEPINAIQFVMGHFNFVVKLQLMVATTLPVILFIKYVDHLIPNIWNPLIRKFYLYSGIILLIPYIILSLHTFTSIIHIYQLYLISSSCFLLYFLTKNLFVKKINIFETKLLIIFFFIIILVTINDTLIIYNAEARVSMVPYGIVVFFVGQAFILARKNARAHNESEYLRENLEHEVQTKTSELKKQAEELKILDVQKTSFYQNISHELRTPLTLIINPLEEERQKHQTSKNIELAEKNARRLLKLVNQLLDFQKTIAGKRTFKIEKINIIKFIESSIEYFKTACRNKGIDFNLTISKNERTKESSNEANIMVEAEIDALEKIIFNLLSNAFKYTEKEGFIHLNIETDNSYVHIFVKDSGLGISKTNQEKLFKVFSQIDDSSTRKYEGTGLGLALVKKLTESMSGEVGVESEYGIGSTFWIKLPLADNQGENLTQQKYESKEWYFEDFIDEEHDDNDSIIYESDSENEIILVIDDLYDMRTLIADTLKKEAKYTVIKAQNGAIGFELVKKYKPGLIIVDWMMPVMTGPEMIENLKSDSELSSIPVVLLTAKSDEESRAKGVEKGADAYLGKPFNEQELLSMVSNLLKLKEKEKSIESALNNLEKAHEELKFAQNKMISQARLALMGKMVSGVSHEIGNPLNSMMAGGNNLMRFITETKQMLDDIDDSSEEIRDLLEVNSLSKRACVLIQDGNSRINKVLKNFRLYIKGGKLPVEEFDITQGVDTCIAMFKKKIDEQNISVKTELNNLPLIKCKAGEISQVITNIIINSIDAMPDGGEIIITGCLVKGKIELTIKDNGPGIPEKHINSIFEPFYSTKEATKGTGLGLYISKEIVTKHYGDLELVDSEKGAEFLIKLPVT